MQALEIQACGSRGWQLEHQVQFAQRASNKLLRGEWRVLQGAISSNWGMLGRADLDEASSNGIN